jgi:DNA invertase Pin-like site-specific DNA recombinase
MKLTNHDVYQAKQMHDSGVTWEIIASYYKIDRTTLRKRLNEYEQQTKDNTSGR